VVNARIARLGVALGVLALDLGTKWAFYDSSRFNPALARADGWLLVAGIAFCVAAYAALATGTVFVSGAAGWGIALWFGGSMGQAIQFVATGSVSDWIPVGPIQNVTMWTNLADIAVAVGALAVIFQWGWRGQSGLHLAMHRQILE
jgi:hypothetical protein